MRGVGYATIEILVLILIAAIIDFLIGWILRRFLYDVDLGAYEVKVAAAEASRKSAQADLAATSERLEGAESELASFQAKFAEAEAGTASLTADLDAAHVAAGEKDSTIEALESELTGLRAELGRVEGLESELTGLRADLDAAIEDAKGKEATVGRLEAELAGAAAIREESEARAARISELEVLVVEKEAVSAGTERIAALEQALDAAKGELAECADRVATRDARIAELEAAAAAAAPMAEVAPVPAPVEAEPEPPSKADAVVAMEAIAARTAGEGPRADDDLKKIHGVGPKLEKLLKSMGITSFRQVARFEPADIAVVTAALDAFPGRIERDDWMSSAAEEHRAKYGEDA